MGLLLVVACLLGAQASPTLVSKNLTTRLKYYVHQLGDPYPYPYPSFQGSARRGGSTMMACWGRRKPLASEKSVRQIACAKIKARGRVLAYPGQPPPPLPPQAW